MRTLTLHALFAFFWLAVVAVPAGATGDSVVAFDKAIEDAKTAMMADPQQALKHVDIALAKSEALSGRQKQIARATGLWLKIEANIGLNRLDAAQADLGEALKLAKTAAPGTKLHGDLMRSQGAIAALSGKASEALRHYLEAHRVFQMAKERRSQAIALQDIGQIYWEAGDYERMLAYFDDAQEIYDDDPAFALSGNNNRGEAYRILGRRAEAEKAYTLALANARAMESPMLETRILSNLALVQIEMGKLKQATSNANLAEKLGAKAEARDWLPFVYGVKATIAAKQGNDRLGAMLLDKLFSGVDLKQTDLTYKEFHKLAADLYARRGQPSVALSHLQAFQRLDSEANDLVTSASSQLLEARFDSANQETRIAQRDIKIARQRSDLVTGLLLAALVIIIVGGYAFLSIRKSRNKVRDANLVLTDVNAKLESAMKAKTEFLAMTSHEIRTPLNGIMGMTQVILADQSIDQETRERVGLVLGAGQTMQSLVDDLLDVAKMENGGITIKKDLANLPDILSDGVRLWQAEASAKDVTITLVQEDMPQIVYTDGGRVRQVVFNLLANAIKFTAGGTVQVTARGLDAESIEIIVEDSGVGIPEDQLELIFEPFHQVDSAMTRNFGGAGLGLSICRNIMTALGGTIAVTSNMGKGSRFTLVLPISHASKDAEADSDTGSAQINQTIIILCCNKLRLAKLKAVMEPNVAGAVAVETYQEALTWLESGNADLLLVDVASPCDGKAELPALSNVVACAKVNRVSTVFLVAPDAEITPEMVRALDPDVLLQKPLKASFLIEAINSNAQSKTIRSEAA